MNCNHPCCLQHPQRRCLLPAGHAGDHTAEGFRWRNYQAPQLNTEHNNQLKEITK